MLPGGSPPRVAAHACASSITGHGRAISPPLSPSSRLSRCGPEPSRAGRDPLDETTGHHADRRRHTTTSPLAATRARTPSPALADQSRPNATCAPQHTSTPGTTERSGLGAHPRPSSSAPYSPWSQARRLQDPAHFRGAQERTFPYFPSLQPGRLQRTRLSVTALDALQRRRALDTGHGRWARMSRVSWNFGGGPWLFRPLPHRIGWV